VNKDGEDRLPRPSPLIERFENLPDPRADRTRKPKPMDIFMIGRYSLLAGGEGCMDTEIFGKGKYDWLKIFLLCHLPLGAEQFGKIARGPLGVENSLR